MRYVNIITLYKNKGDRSDFNNYRGVGNICCSRYFDKTADPVVRQPRGVTPTSARLLAERTLPESQCRFRTGSSTINMIFSVRQLQEKCREQRRPLFGAFIDIREALEDYSVCCRTSAISQGTAADMKLDFLTIENLNCTFAVSLVQCVG